MVKFNYTGVENCCTELEASLRRIKAIHDDCEAQIKKINSGSVWAGPASEGFVSRARQTIQTCRTMERSLMNLIAYIRNCQANYKKVDDSIIKMMNQFKF